MFSETIRDGILKSLQMLPSDATYDDAIERIVLLAKIDAGLAQLDAGESLSHDEVKHRFRIRLESLGRLKPTEISKPSEHT